MEHSFKGEIKRGVVEDDLVLRNDSNGTEAEEEEQQDDSNQTLYRRMQPTVNFSFFITEALRYRCTNVTVAVTSAYPIPFS